MRRRGSARTLSLVTRHRLRLTARAPGQVFVALRGQHADGRRSRARRSSAALSHRVAEQPAPADVARAVGAGERRAAGAGAAWRPLSTAIRAAGCRWSASPARTARPRRPISSRRFSRRPASAAACSARSAYRIGDEVREATRTTPEAPDVQRCCARWSIAGAAPARWKCRRTRWRCIASTA